MICEDCRCVPKAIRVARLKSHLYSCLFIQDRAPTGYLDFDKFYKGIYIFKSSGFF